MKEIPTPDAFRRRRNNTRRQGGKLKSRLEVAGLVIGVVGLIVKLADQITASSTVHETAELAARALNMIFG
ncbi:hypothetical protein F3087_39500 [Nocardia colli]|uniref:Uncharacterized protein n=1 Tax=Nocardia colli TaxID=2545717 RepID=A0A5N0E1N3_9NOCA|nr:hypothetical protein [Nocardia colli]KAA8882135.1 hypothetical protein F3087_39500 [Nocardia colli]